MTHFTLSAFGKTDLDRLLDRFVLNTKKTPNGCVEWSLMRNKNGYGKILAFGEKRLSHRISYELFVGPIPDGFYVCHRCDNPSCCNPSHLFVGTQKDNLGDAKRKGRTATGDRNGSRTRPDRVARGDRHSARLYPERIQKGEDSASASLTNAQAVEIRKRYAEGGITQRELASEYSVDQVTISRVVLRKTYFIV